VEFNSAPGYFVLAGIHYIAGVVPVLATHLLIDAPLTKMSTLVLAGLCVSVLYNISAAFEEWVSEFVWRVERKHLR